jgi:hypothetical protein
VNRLSKRNETGAVVVQSRGAHTKRVQDFEHSSALSRRIVRTRSGISSPQSPPEHNKIAVLEPDHDQGPWGIQVGTKSLISGTKAAARFRVIPDNRNSIDDAHRTLLSG